MLTLLGPIVRQQLFQQGSLLGFARLSLLPLFCARQTYHALHSFPRLREPANASRADQSRSYQCRRLTPAAHNGTDTDVKRKVLLAVDNSEDSELACRWAIHNLYRRGDEFHILHVVPFLPDRSVYLFPDGAFVSVPPPPQLANELMRIDADAVSELYTRICSDANVPCSLELVREVAPDGSGIRSVGEVICSAAQQLQAAAVVMASHGRSALAEFTLGSVSAHVVHHASQPVVIVHHSPATSSLRCDAHPVTSSRNIVLAVDDSEGSEMACQWAIDHLVRADDVMHVLHVLPSAENTMPAADTAQHTGSTAAGSAQALQQRFVSRLQRAAVQHTFEFVRNGHAAGHPNQVGAVICSRAEAMQRSMIVMHARNHGIMRELLFGSVSSYCLHHASVPVVIVH